MKKILLLMLLVASSAKLWAQSPNWVDDYSRNMQYPAQEYITGFAVASPYGGESQTNVCTRAAEDAARQAAASIRVLIQSSTVMETSEVEVNGDFNFVQTYKDLTTQSANAEIAGLKTLTYYDANNATGYAFAYALKSDLSAYYATQIAMNLDKVEDAISLARSTANAGQKNKATEYCTNALEPLAKAEFAQDLLTAIAPQNRSALQLQRTSELKKQLFQCAIDMQQSMVVCLIVSETNYSSPSTLLAGKLKSILAQNGCSFTNDKTAADYTLTITATTRNHDVDNPNFKFAYADVIIDLYSKYKGMSVFSNEISVKGGATTYQSAGKKALQDAAPTIYDEIASWVER